MLTTLVDLSPHF